MFLSDLSSIFEESVKIGQQGEGADCGRYQPGGELLELEMRPGN